MATLDEINDLEDSVLQIAVGDSDDESVATVPNVPKRKKESKGSKDKNGRIPRKKQLVKDIVKFRPFLGDLIPTDNKLRKTRIKDLEKLLAQCVKDSMNLGVGIGNDLDSITDPTPPGNNYRPEGDDTPTAAPPSIRSGADALCLAYLALTSMVEKISENTAPLTGVQVEGWRDSVEERKDELTQLLAAVYNEHNQILGTYVNPTSMLALFTLTSALPHVKKADLGASPENDEQPDGEPSS